MKFIALLLVSVGIISACELVVIVPLDEDADGSGIGYPSVQAFADGDFDIDPMMDVSQEGQIVKYTYSGVKPGMYRVTLDANGNPFGCAEILMETHVRIDEGKPGMVFLYAPRHQAISIPEDVASALKKHPKGMIDLSAKYEGSKKSFAQARSLPGQINGLGAWIHYLRPDAEYTLQISDVVQEGDRRSIAVVFKKTFKIGVEAALGEPASPVK